MKVLEPGKPPEPWSIECRCTGNGNGGGGCNALLKVEEDDLYTTASSARGEVTYYTTFRCIACGVETDIRAELVPTHVVTKLMARRASDLGA